MNDVTLQTTLAIGGIIFIFFGTIGYIILPKTGMRRKVSRWTRISLGMIGIVFLIIGGIFYLFQTPPTSLSIPTPTLTPTQAPTPSQTPTPSPTPPVEPYMVYNDIGIAAGDVRVWSGADRGLEPPLLVDGSHVTTDAPEGTTSFAVTSGSGHNNYVGWGVFLGVFRNHKLITPHTVDLSDYKNLEFWVKTPIDLKVEIQQDNLEGKKSFSSLISNHGWNSSLPDVWQKVTISRDAFRNVDFTKTFYPFMITGKGSKITFYIDKVMWIP